MAVALGVRKLFQQQQARALGPGDAVGRGGEGLAAAVGRESALAAELDEPVRGGHHRDPAREGQGALARAQRLCGEVHRDQRRRARGVDREARPA